ncbi:MAG TPA: hypothetical protein VK992_06575 [Candidatus Caenarcaniphilales bacterium]|nr:hypothetical protein [Candidatus Caenarcaniphilales bacterium]
MKSHAARLTALIAVSVFGLACGGTGGGTGQASPAASGGEVEASTVPIPGGFPQEVTDEIFADAQQRTGAGRQDLTIWRAQETVWTDESLECPGAGESPAEAQIEGYQIVLQYEVPGADQVLLDYRARSDGSFIFCENALPGAT